VELATVLHNLGMVRFHQGDLDEGERTLSEALEMRRRLLGYEHPSVALSLNNLGTLHLERGDLPSAEHLLRQALSLQTRLLGEEHSYVAIGLRGLAEALRRQGDLSQAGVLFDRALDIQRRTLPVGHPEIGETLHLLGSLRFDQNEYAAAEELYLQAWSSFDGRISPDHLVFRRLAADLASLYRTTGRPTQAEWFRRHSDGR
jgi:tetratricopeptide (TPR) repeat protein